MLLGKVATELVMDTSILRKIERNDGAPTKEMLPIFYKVFERDLTEVEVKSIARSVMTQFSDPENLKEGINEVLKNL